jgi:hypothetical protein
MAELTPNLAVLVGEHAEKILALASAGFFTMRNGSIECFFDKDGRLRKIDSHVSIQVFDAH